MKYLFGFGIQLFLLLCISWGGYTQSQNLTFERLTVEQGLSHNYVMSVLQDRKGYLWFGTGNGLDKYDGYQFTNYKFDPKDSTTLPKNQVISLWEDSAGIIWIGTSEGTSKFDPKTEQFTRLEKDPKNLYAFKYAQSFQEDKEGNLWVGGSFEGELRTINKKTGKFSATNYATLLKPTSDKNLKNALKLYFLYKDKRGTLWIGSPFGLHRLNLTSQGAGKPAKISFTHFRHNPNDVTSISPNGVAGIYEDHSGVFWILTHDGKLDAFEPKSGKFTHYQLKPLPIFGLLRTDMAEDVEKNLWIGTINGLYRLDKTRKILTPFLHNPANSQSISNNFIVSLLVDKAGILWAVTTEGINKLDPHQKPFTSYVHIPQNPYSLSHNKVAAICEDKAGVVWVGTMGGGLDALNKKTGLFTHFKYNPKDVNSLRSDTVSALLEDSDGNLWIANGDVISVYNRKNQKFTHHALSHPFLPNNSGFSIFTIHEDSQKLLWLGTNNGILSFDRQTGKTIHFPYDPDNPTGISDYWALSIREDKNGNLWIGAGSQALNRFDRKTGKFTHYKHDKRNPGSIASNTGPSIYEDTKGNLWFGTGEGGLCLYNHETDSFTTFTDKDGLAGNAVFSILEDNTGNLWLGTNNGLSRFSMAEKKFTNFDATDGLQSKLFTTLYTTGVAHKGMDGTLYFGGNNGFNAFNPVSIRSNTFIPPIVITEFRLFDKPLPGKSEAREIQLDYDQNFFSLEFAALNFTSTQKNQYAYQLEGVDKEWVQAGTRRLASYTNVGPGSYTFKVKGSNNDGVWNEQGTTLTIIIHPPWWRTWTAYAFYGLCFLAVLVLVDRIQRQRLVKREREKAREKELAQAKEIEKAYQELKQTQNQLVQKEKMASLGELTAGIAHEIQNPLNFVNNFSEVSTELVEELKQEANADHKEGVLALAANLEQNLQKIYHHGQRADAIVKNMLQHSRQTAGEKQLTDLNALADEYLHLAYHGLRAKDKEFNANLVTDFDKDLGKVEVVPQEIGRVLINLYNNAFYAIHQKKNLLNGQYQPEVKVATIRHNGKIEIKVRDNGMGMPESVKSKIFQPFFTTKPSGLGTGLGLSLSYDIINKGHNGDLKVFTKEGEFCEFVVELPLNISSAV